MQVVIDALSMFNYVGYGAADLKEMMVEHCGQMDFYANKILKDDKALDSAWVSAFREVNKAILAFLLSNLNKVSTWHGSEDGDKAEAHFLSIVDAAMLGEIPVGSMGAQKAAQAVGPIVQASAPAGSGSLADRYRAEVMSKSQALRDAVKALNIP